MSGFARKLKRRNEAPRVLTSTVEPAAEAPSAHAVELARPVVAWRGNEELLDLAARTIESAQRTPGIEPATIALVAHIATCDTGGELGKCTHSQEELLKILPGWGELERDELDRIRYIM
jgi:hypothetical protein